MGLVLGFFLSKAYIITVAKTKQMYNLSSFHINLLRGISCDCKIHT